MHGLVEAFALISGFAVSAWGGGHELPRSSIILCRSELPSLRSLLYLWGRFEADDPLRGVVHFSIQLSSTPISLQLIFFPSALTEMVFRDVDRQLLWIPRSFKWRARDWSLGRSSPTTRTDAGTTASHPYHASPLRLRPFPL